jgi:hypothetical protein
MKVGTKVITKRELPETATHAPIPKDTPCVIALHFQPDRQQEMYQQGFTYVRFAPARLGYEGKDWVYLFIPTDALERRP